MLRSAMFMLPYVKIPMMPFGKARRPFAAGLFCLSLLATTIAQPAQAQKAAPSKTVPVDTSAEPADLRASGFLSIPGGQKLMSEASSAFSAGNYGQAVKKLQEARQVYNQISNFYQDLATSFGGVDSRIADGLRTKALSTAQLRDEATYQLALAHRAQNQPELAIPLLVQIIRSQQITRDMGKKAYNQLVELGFADTPYPRPASK
jgi:thioredoxin-like negative regulator of GroEL